MSKMTEPAIRQLYQACLQSAAELCRVSLSTAKSSKVPPAARSRAVARAATVEISGWSNSALARAIGVNHTTIRHSRAVARPEDVAHVLKDYISFLPKSREQREREEHAEDVAEELRVLRLRCRALESDVKEIKAALNLALEAGRGKAA